MKTTTIEQWVLRLAGLFILVSLGLAHWHHPNWLWLTAFVGLNMLQTSFTGFCPLAMALHKMGIPAGAAFYKNTTL